MRVVLTSYGTHGDILPFVGIGTELNRLGHTAVLGASSFFEPLARAHGLAFAPVAPHHADQDRDLGMNHTERLARAFHPVLGGLRFTAGKMTFPYLDQIIDELDAACAGADLLLASPSTPWAYLIARKRHLPWHSVHLHAAALGLLSGQDPVVPSLRWPAHELSHCVGARRYGRFLSLLRKSSRPLVRPLDRKAAEIGVYDKHFNPMIDGCYSPHGTLALFPQQLMRQPMPTDLPPNLKLDFLGFSYFDGAQAALPPSVQAFLNVGDPPVVFTVGSSVAFMVQDIYREWSRVCAKLGLRAIFLASDQSLAHACPPTQMVVPWVSVSALFPHCRGVVSVGGIGICAQALHAGLPHLVVPVGFDQPDNAWRIARMGGAKTLLVSKARGRAFERALQEFVDDDALRARVKRLQLQINQTCGSVMAARLLDSRLAAGRLAA